MLESSQDGNYEPQLMDQIKIIAALAQVCKWKFFNTEVQWPTDVDKAAAQQVLDDPNKHSIFATLGSHLQRGQRFLNEAKEALKSWNAFYDSEVALQEKLQALIGVPDAEAEERLIKFDETFSALTPGHLEKMSEKTMQDIFLRVDAALKATVARVLDIWYSPGIASFKDWKVEPLQQLQKILAEMSIYKFQPGAFEKFSKALEYCIAWSTSEHCRSIIVEDKMPDMTSTEMESIMGFADTGPVKSISSAASSILAQVFELYLRGKVSARLKGCMDQPIQDMATHVRKHALVADCILKGETPTLSSEELSDFKNEEAAWAHLDKTAQSLGDRSFEEALGLLHKWMAVVAWTTAVMIENNSEKKVEALKTLCTHVESFDFLGENGLALDMQYLMGTDTTFHALLSASGLSGQDMFICCALWLCFMLLSAVMFHCLCYAVLTWKPPGGIDESVHL